MELTLTPQDWAEAARVATMHLERKFKYARRNARAESRPRNYQEALRVGTDGLVCELALQKQYIPHAPWNAYSEDLTLADIGESYEVRGYNCMTNEEIRDNWARLGHNMQEIKKDNFPFDFICKRGHLEIYAKDIPERHCTFVVIASADRAYVVGGISIAMAQSYKDNFGKNPQYLRTKREEDKLYWTPVSLLHAAHDCPWYDQPLPKKMPQNVIPEDLRRAYQ